MIAPLNLLLLPVLLPQVPSSAGAIPSVTGTPTEFKTGAQATDPSDVISHTSAGGTDPAVLVVVMAKTLTQTSPVALTITVDYGATSDINQIGASTTTGVGTSPTIRAFLLQNPPAGAQNVTVSMTCTDDIDARAVIIYDLVDVQGAGSNPATTVDNSAPQAEGSLSLPVGQANSLALAWFAHRGAPSTFTPGSNLVEIDQDDTGNISETSDISWVAMSRDVTAAGTEAIAAGWSNAGRYQGLAVEIEGTPGTVPPTVVNDTANAVAGGSAITADVLANDGGTSLTISAASIGSGTGSVAIVSNQLEFTPPGSADTTVINYTATNAEGSDSGTLTVTTSAAAADNDFGAAPSSTADDDILLLTMS